MFASMKCSLPWNVRAHEMFAPMKCSLPWNVRAHEMFASMKCARQWNVRAHEMFAPMKCSRPYSYYLGSAESPTSDSFSVRLKSSLSDIVASPPCSPQVGICSQTGHLIWAASLLSCTGTTCPNIRVLSKYLRPRIFPPFFWEFSPIFRGRLLSS